MIEHLFVAPLGVLLGWALSRIDSEETKHYDREFLWFFGLFVLIGIFFSQILWAGILAGVVAVASLYYRQVALLSLAVAAQAWASSFTGAVFILLAVAVACGYLVHHERRQSLWVLALVPTLISAILLLL